MKRIAALFLVLMLLTGCGKLDKDTVATVNGEPIKKVDFDTQISKMKVVNEAQGLSVPEKDLRQQVLNRLITEKLVRQAAKKEGIEIPLQKAEEQLEMGKKRLPEDQWKDLMKSRHLTEQDIVQYFQNELTNQALIKKLGGEEKFAQYIEGFRMNAKIEKAEI